MASSSTTAQCQKYDVFLSFRGEDTRNNFTSHLYKALCQRKIETFIDDQLNRGDEISDSLFNTIKASKISVIIFSKNYASSRWCLQELEKVLECKNNDGQIVLPIFYHVDPSNVKKQEGSFGEGFAKLENSFKDTKMLQSWRTALKAAGSLSGSHIDDKTRESDLIDDISGDILKRLNKLSSSYSGDLVGIESSIQRIESMLHIGSNDFCVVGIWGLGGIGKTTLARVVFDRNFSKFESYYFAENVREQLEKHKCLPDLRKELLFAILGDREANIGLNGTRERLGQMKFLIVYDDITSFDQIEKLIHRDCLGSGSQIIITTRDKQVLRNCKVGDEFIYEVKGLCDDDAHQLFRHYAFSENSPTKDYMELANKIVKCTQGLPLALKVLGSYLVTRELQFWKRVVSKLQNGTYLDIHKVLKISYDGLEKDEKNIFLDIICFFKGDDKTVVMASLEVCYNSIVEGILEVLRDKCLITIWGEKITMHDLIEEMGKKIAREEYSSNNLKQIRLWDQNGINTVLKRKKWIESIQSISLDIRKLSHAGFDYHVMAEEYSLRFLKVYKSYEGEDFESYGDDIANSYEEEDFVSYEDDNANKLNGFEDLESFSTDIIYFCWRGYPFKSLPFTFCAENLVTLDMRYSKVEQLWDGVQDLSNLKYIYLTGSQHITKLPNLSRASKLQDLILAGCRNISSLPDGIQSKCITLTGCSNLEIAPKISYKVEELDLSLTAIKESPLVEIPSRLVKLVLSGCSRLKSLSGSICKLKLLKLDLTYCKNLSSLPDGIQSKCITLTGCSSLEIAPKISCTVEELDLGWTAIKESPLVENSFRLVKLVLSNCFQLKSLSGSICKLKLLKYLYLKHCSSLERLPNDFGDLEALEVFETEGTIIREVPSSILSLNKIKSLSLSHCPENQAAPMNWIMNSSLGSSSLESLYLQDCGMTRLPDNLKKLSSLKELYISGNDFESIPAIMKDLSYLRHLDISNCNKLQYLPELPRGLNVVADGCSSLQSLSDSSFLFSSWSRLQKINFANCDRLDLRKFLHKEYIAQQSGAHICFLGNEIPEWFNFQNEGSSIILDQSSDQHNKSLLGFYICAVVSPVPLTRYGNLVNYDCLIKSKDGEIEVYQGSIYPYDNDRSHLRSDRLSQFFRCKKGGLKNRNSLRSDHVLLGFQHKNGSRLLKEWGPLNEEDELYMKAMGNSVNIRFFGFGVKVNKCGIHFLHVEDYPNTTDGSRRNVESDEEEDKCKPDIFDDSISRTQYMSKFEQCVRPLRLDIERKILRRVMRDALLYLWLSGQGSGVEKVPCENSKGCMCFLGSEIPEWFDIQNPGYQIELPRGAISSKIVGLAFCTVVASRDWLYEDTKFLVECTLYVKRKDNSYENVATGSIESWFQSDKAAQHINSDMVFLGYDCLAFRNLSYDSEARINFSVTTYGELPFWVKKCGVRFLYAKDFGKSIEKSIRCMLESKEPGRCMQELRRRYFPMRRKSKRNNGQRN